MRVFCVFGDDRVQRSKSPAMHNKAFGLRNFDAHYVSFSVEPGMLETAMKGFRAMGFSGANVTIPHKENIVQLLDGLTSTANKLQAVNTLYWQDGALIGDNTDVGGFCDALPAVKCMVVGKKCLVLGNGGAARGVVMGLLLLGASQVFVTGRQYNKSRQIAQCLEADSIRIEQIATCLREVSLIVNATPVSSPGEADESMNWLAGSIEGPEIELIFDINYGRSENIWENSAKRIGAEFSDGLIMLAAQAARSFNLWTGESATVSEFMAHLG